MLLFDLDRSSGGAIVVIVWFLFVGSGFLLEVCGAPFLFCKVCRKSIWSDQLHAKLSSGI